MDIADETFPNTDITVDCRYLPMYPVSIVDASMQVQSDPAGSQSYLVLITMDEEGKNAFAAVTAEHIGEAISIYVNDELISAPVIQMPITDGKAVISGNFTMDEAKTLSKMLSPEKPELS